MKKIPACIAAGIIITTMLGSCGGSPAVSTSAPADVSSPAVQKSDAVSETGAVTVTDAPEKELSDREKIIRKAILDTGNTLKYIVDMLGERKPKSVSIVTLLDKPSRRVADVKADYVGVDVPNEFVVGYGLDYNQYYRNLPYIGVLRREVYEGK